MYLISKYEYKILRKIYKKDSADHELIGIISDNLISDTLNTLLVQGYVDVAVRNGIRYFFATNKHKCSIALKEYRKDIARAWVPICLSVIAIIISAIALIKAW